MNQQKIIQKLIDKSYHVTSVEIPNSQIKVMLLEDFYKEKGEKVECKGDDGKIEIAKIVFCKNKFYKKAGDFWLMTEAKEEPKEKETFYKSKVVEEPKREIEEPKSETIFSKFKGKKVKNTEEEVMEHIREIKQWGVNFSKHVDTNLAEIKKDIIKLQKDQEEFFKELKVYADNKKR